VKNLLTQLKRIIEWGGKIQLGLGIFLLAVIVLTLTAGIISRYCFNNPFDWTEELSTFLFIWVSFLGAGVASVKRRHVTVDFFTSKFPKENLKKVRVVTNSIIILLMAVVAVGSVILLPQMTSHSSVALNISKVWFYLPICLVSFYMILVYLADVLEDIQDLKSKNIVTDSN
jgi:TRAP-type C4-dicarboxylate transport system permease small subunit